MLRQNEPFQGNTKEELMVYLSSLHNRVNKRLGKPAHDCTKVKE